MTKNVFFVLILSVLQMACFSHESDSIEVANVYKVYNQDKAMLIVEGDFRDTYGLSSSNAFERAKIHWTDTPCPYQDEWAVVVDRHCHPGISWGCEKIFVAMDQNNPNRTCPTALVHEFGHCLRTDAGWDSDSGHKDKDFWDFIEAEHQETCDRGW